MYYKVLALSCLSLAEHLYHIDLLTSEIHSGIVWWIDWHLCGKKCIKIRNPERYLSRVLQRYIYSLLSLSLNLRQKPIVRQGYTDIICGML